MNLALLVLALGALTIGLCVAAVIAPRRWLRARESYLAAGISPLWIMLPLLVFVAWAGGVAPGIGESVLLVLLGTLLLLQLVLGVLVVYRHRRWLWTALPLAVVPFIWWAAAFVAFAQSYRPH